MLLKPGNEVHGRHVVQNAINHAVELDVPEGRWRGVIPVATRVAAVPLVEAVKSYRRWNEVRVCLLLVAALVNLSVYYWTMDTTGVLCAGMVLVASLFCIPGRERVVSELDLQRNEERAQ